MLTAPLKNALFRKLFAAQLISLLGTGLATIALALMVYQQYPGHAGAILGGVLAVKMVAYLGVAPIVGGYAHRLPRRTWLAALNAGRALMVALLPFAESLWQLALLMFLLNAMAAGYTPVYQALLPDILPDEKRYTEALSLSRLAMEMESLLSPLLATLLLLAAPYALLFELNALAFGVAVILLLRCQLPKAAAHDRSGGIWQHVSFGVRSYWNTPRLKAVLLLNLAMSAAGAMIIVNTVIYVQAQLGLGEEQVPLLMASAGCASMLAAFILPTVLERIHDRPVMVAGGFLFVVALLVGSTMPDYSGLFPIWFVIGFASAMVLIPTGRVVRSSCNPQDRNDFFSANFALTHGMWLICYLLAGMSGELIGLQGTFVLLAGVALVATVAAMRHWPSDDHSTLWHEHPETEHLHPHTHDAHHQHDHEGWEGPEPHVHPHYHAKQRHRHKFVIDEHHLSWPRQ